MTASVLVLAQLVLLVLLVLLVILVALPWGAASAANAHQGAAVAPPRGSASPRAVSRTSSAAATGLALSSSPRPRADRSIEVYGNCQSPAFEPRAIIVACADAGVRIEGLRWTSWTDLSASGVGTLVYNDCTPNCATGRFHAVPNTRISLTDPVRGAGGRLVWSEIEEQPQPPGYATGPLHGRPQPLAITPLSPVRSS